MPGGAATATDEAEAPRPMPRKPVAEVRAGRRSASTNWRSAEEFLLTVTDTGFGKRSSAYEYRVTGRGGQGIANITLAPRNGTAVAASFPVRPGDDVMLVTDAGRLIRVPADQVRVTGRAGDGRHAVPRRRRRARDQRLPGGGGCEIDG